MREIFKFQAHIDKTEGDIKELTENAVNLKSNFLELTELHHVLEKTRLFFSETGETQVLDANQIAQVSEDGGQLGFVAGVINRERLPAFERMLWVVSRGNVFLKRSDIYETLEDPRTVSIGIKLL